MKTAIYPGSFDPITYGHINIIERGLAMCDNLIVAVARNISKTSLFTVEERMQMVRDSVGNDPRIEVDSFDGLLVHYARQKQSRVILRGLRAISDFEYEFQMAHMNHRLEPDTETVFIMTSQDHFYVSSSLVREVAQFGGDISGLVPDHVEKRILEHFSKRK
ncbi:pantetheine-phosphate adenylyltransferase [Myxococcota bacterium]|nr:pantetheine-phosphate adenylyltransferase [Myxococcota bacterium]